MTQPTHSFADDLAARDPSTADFFAARPTPAPASEGDIPPGYELGELVGAGGMGVVYRARDVNLGRDVAVKLLRSGFAADSPQNRRFVREARITGQLQHPGVPAVYQAGTTPAGRPFLAMKLIKGDTLEDKLSRGESVNALAVFEAVCQAVGYAHAHGVIHRDLKPANVMVGAFGEVQVMDWGLATVLAPGGEADPDDAASGTVIVSAGGDSDQLTRAGSSMGTPAYMPPEQAAGAVGSVNPQSDVFGLGALSDLGRSCARCSPASRRSRGPARSRCDWLLRAAIRRRRWSGSTPAGPTRTWWTCASAA